MVPTLGTFIKNARTISWRRLEIFLTMRFIKIADQAMFSLIKFSDTFIFESFNYLLINHEGTIILSAASSPGKAAASWKLTSTSRSSFNFWEWRSFGRLHE